MIALVMAMRHRFTTFRLCAISLGLAACQKDAEPDASPPPAQAASASPSAPSPAPALASASARPPSAETPFPGQELKVGSFVETSAYKFKVSHVVRCADPKANEQVPDDRRVRVAAKVEVFSKYDNLFVSEKDVELQKDGVIINSEKDAKPSAECTPLLARKRIQHDETTTGYVVFQVPDEAFVRGATVAFEPTRWGSAPRAEIPIAAKDFSEKAATPGAKK
jgi:hypothetical protein